MPSPITPELVYHLTAVADPSLSSPGSLLAFTRSSVDRATMEHRSSIAVMGMPAQEVRPLTEGPHDTSARFAPDESAVAFLREDSDERRQLWLTAAAGGEPRQLTEVPGGLRQFAWSPDGSWLAFTADVDPDRPPVGHDPKIDPRVRVVTRIKYRADTLGWRGDAHTHVFIVSVAGGEPVQLTDGDWDDLGPSWSPDGQSIAFISHRREDRDFVPYSEAYVVPVSGGEPERWSDELSEVASIAWSPDGRRLAVVGSDDDAMSATWQGGLFVLARGRSPRRLTGDEIKLAAGIPPTVPAPEVRWTEDDRILSMGDVRGESFLFEVHAETGAARRIGQGGAQYQSVAIDAAGRSAVVLAATPSSAGDLHLVDIADSTDTQLTAYNGEYFDEHPTAKLEKYIITRGGMDIECRLLFPPEFDTSRKHPLVVDIHGGPHGAFYDAFNATQQVLATSGYLVLLVNPRGSSTYGGGFAKAVLSDWGGEDYRDIMAAVDEVCSRPYVDADRLGVHGYSYGGFMTSWIVGHETRFRAAVAGAPCINLVSMYGTSDIGVSFGERQWGGTRIEAAEAFRERSPLTYADKVQTPLLLLHGEADVRCPIEQSEQFFVALRRLDKTVEFVRFPDCSHAFLRMGHPRMREEYLGRTLDWFDRWLKRPAGG